MSLRNKILAPNSYKGGLASLTWGFAGRKCDLYSLAAGNLLGVLFRAKLTWLHIFTTAPHAGAF